MPGERRQSGRANACVARRGGDRQSGAGCALALRRAKARSRIKAASTWRPCAAMSTAISTLSRTQVGNETRVLVSDLSGRGNLLEQGGGDGLGSLQGRSRTPSSTTVKDLESTTASLLKARKHRWPCACAGLRPIIEPLFNLIDFTVIVEDRRGRGTIGRSHGQAGCGWRCRAYRGRGQWPR